MPELPEVETISRGLCEHLTGRQLMDVTLNRPNMRFDFPSDLQERLIGARILDVARRAKYLLFHLDSGDSVIAHLGMSGTMVICRCEDYHPRTHDHVLWETDDGHSMVFNDPRRFGFMLIWPTTDLTAHPMLADLGPEPLESGFTQAYLEKALATRKSPVKLAIMDQKLVVGVGNIYASEALFRARISPFAPAHSVAPKAKKLIAAIQTTLQDAIRSGGSTLRDYVRSSGDSGYFQHAFAVYDRASEPCLLCKTPVSHAVQSGRSTYFCHKCQPVE